MMTEGSGQDLLDYVGAIGMANVDFDGYRIRIEYSSHLLTDAIQDTVSGRVAATHYDGGGLLYLMVDADDLDHQVKLTIGEEALSGAGSPVIRCWEMTPGDSSCDGILRRFWLGNPEVKARV